MSHPSGQAEPQEPADRSGGQPGASPPEPGPDPLRAVLRDLAALRAYASHYVAARIDAGRARFRLAILWTAVGLVAGVAALAALVTAVVLLILGAADLLAVVLDRPWAGKLAAGAGLLIGMALGAAIGLRRWLSSSRKKTRAKYERRRSEQRSALGQDAVQRAAAQPDAE